MRSIKLSSLCQAVALCSGALLMSGAALAANGDKAAYEQTKASAKSTYEADRKHCDALAKNAKDICVAEAKAKRTKADVQAEADWKNTPKARENAVHESAEADYDVAKQKCQDKAGNDKDVCMKEAKAAETHAKADAKAMRKSSDAKMEARDDKRDADYKVAAEKCDAMAGDAKNSCMVQAKAHYGK